MPTDLAAYASAVVFIGATAFLLYGPVAQSAEVLARRIAPRLPQAAVYPIDHVRSLVALPAFGILGLTIYVVSCALVGVSPLAAVGDTTLGLLLLGALLGIAEAALALILASTMIVAIAPFRLRGMPPDAINTEMRIVGRSGWIRLYDHVLQMRPWPVPTVAIALPLMAEELLFRGLAVTLLRPEGAVAAVALTTAIFMAAQIAGMPSWFSSVPAICGALVVGLVHAYLFWAVPTLTPLLLAHLTFFLFIARR